MVRYDKTTVVFAVSLSALAGYTDARGYLGIGSFVSFMSGNSTRLGIALAARDISKAAVIAGIIATFVVGVVAGTLVGNAARANRAPVVLAFVTLLLAAAAAAQQLAMGMAAKGWEHSALGAAGFAAMVIAMGAENAVFQEGGEVTIGLTYMTGTLVKMGQRISAAILGGPKWNWAPYACLWFGLVAGATAGAATRAYGLWPAALYAAGLTIIAARMRSITRLRTE